MGKLMNRLQKQLKTEYRKDAEDCIQIYDKLKEMDNGRVWKSKWQPLVGVSFHDSYPYERKYKPTSIGYIFLTVLKQ